MLRIPRGIFGRELAKLLSKYDYEITRQKESHIRLVSSIKGNEHKITIPNHESIRIGTLNSILNDVSNYLEESKEELVTILFGK